VEQTAGFFDCRRSRSPLSRQVHSDHREQTVKSEERRCLPARFDYKVGELGEHRLKHGTSDGKVLPLGTQCAETKDLYNTIILFIFPNNFGLISNDLGMPINNIKII